MFNRSWPKQPEAEGDKPTDDDAARQMILQNRIASVDMDTTKKREEEVEEEDTDEE